MKIISTHSKVKSIYDAEYKQTYDAGDVYLLLLCPTCDGISLSKHYSNNFLDFINDCDSEKEKQILYPADTKMPLGLPDRIRKSYLSSLKVRNIDANAYGVLIGRTLELICEDRKAKGNFLGQKLGDLANKGEIPEKIVNLANNLKDLRNIGAHASLGELTDAEVPILGDLCRAILEYVYSAPYLVKHAQERLKKLKEKKKA